MAYYLQTIGVVLLALLGVYFGRFFSQLGRPNWLLGYILPFLIVGTVAVARRWPSFGFAPPFSWIMAGRMEFVALSLACTMLLTTVFMRLPQKRPKVMVGAFMGSAVVYLSVLPFLLPAFLQRSLSSLESNFDSDHVCLQSNHYNCGPASAVTALRQLGISAQEGEIAVLSHTNPVSGTEPDSLCEALTERYSEQGLSCEHRFFKSVSDLRAGGAAVVLIRYSFFIDHYVAVLEISDEGITLGDPLEGKRSLSNEEFKKIWRSSGIVLKRKTSGK